MTQLTRHLAIRSYFLAEIRDVNEIRAAEYMVVRTLRLGFNRWHP
jgi:hypothetical protein